MKECKGLKGLVERFGGGFLTFSEPDPKRLQEVWSKKPNEEVLEKLRAELEMGSGSPKERYDKEYLNNLYFSYKPGIDDEGLKRLAIFSPEIVIEVGAGPAHLCQTAQEIWGCEVWAMDIARHPSLSRLGIHFKEGDITCGCPQDLVQGKTALIVLSYCLDRVSDQWKAIANLAALVRVAKQGSKGLITVCLPAEAVSPGVNSVEYGGGEWITKGEDPLEDYALIITACEEQRLRLFKGGLTTHYGVSLDGYEELPCYVASLV